METDAAAAPAGRPFKSPPPRPRPPPMASEGPRLTFRRLQEADARLNLGPVNGLIFCRVLHHELEQLHRDDVVIV